MNAGKAIYYLLANNATVSAITTRIFPEVAPQDADAPFIVYRLTSVSPDDTHDGPAVIDEVRFDVICVSETYDQAADIGSAARVALDRVYGTYSGVNVESIQFDNVNVYVRDQPRQYGQELTFIVRVKRDAVQIATGSQIEALNLWRLADVDDEITDAIDRQALVYDEATSQWIADGVGQVVIPVRNNSRDTNIEVGTVIKAVGTQGDRILVDPFNPDLDDTKFLVGIASEQLGFTDLTANGHAQVYGELRAIDTDSFNLGDVLYPQSDGTLGTTENVYPVAIVTRKQQNTGRIFIRMWTPGKGYHQRYRTEAAAEMFVGVGATVELYYTATADGDGFVTQDLTAAVGDGNVEERVLRYKSGAFGDSGTTTGYTDAGLATDATYAEMLTAFNNLLATEGAPITIYATRAEVADRSGLLADYPGAAAAYSLRLLDTTYTGSAIRVRRASDSAEQDIGFDGNGDLDTTALATFCSGTNGFVKTWYDQSGNANDATQATTGSQPKIYDSTNGVIEDGSAGNEKPAIDWNGSSHQLIASVTISSALASTSFVVANPDVVSGNRRIYNMHDGATGDERNSSFVNSQFNIFDGTNGILAGSPSAGEQYIITSRFVTGDGTIHANGTLQGTSAAIAQKAITTLSIGKQDVGTAFYFDGKIQAVILYPDDQSANRTGIESNINTHYSIYTP